MSEVVTPSSPSRPSGRHQIKRSITEFALPVKLKGPHSRHSTHIPRKDRHRHDTREPQSAHPTLVRHSVDMPRPEPLPQSRRESGLVVVVDTKDEDSSKFSPSRLQSQASEEKLRQERDKAIHRIDGLKQSLVHLQTFSTAATRRLDESYYTVLEKMSALQNTVATLKDLAETSQDIYGTFETESRELQADITGQLNALGRFDEQQSKIESLQGRVRGGRAKIQTLSHRVDVVRDRVESWERADQEWQQRTRRRLKYTWTMMFIMILAIVGLMLIFQYGTSSSSMPVPDRLIAYLSKRPGHKRFNSSSFGSPLGALADGETRESLLWTKPMGHEERLRGFDDL